jgi:hypothetical protein
MASKASNLFGEINRVLIAIRNAFDAQYLPSSAIEKDLPAIKAAYIHLEEIRYSFRAKTSRRHKLSNDDIYSSIKELFLDLNDFYDKRYFSQISYISRYRVSPRLDYFNFLDTSLADSIPPDYAMRLLLSSLDRILTEGIPEFGQIEIDLSISDEKSVDTEVLRKIVPRHQSVSPVQFDITDGRLVIAHQASIPLEGSQSAASSAKEDLVERGANLISQLSNSNCDPRLLKSIEDLQNQLTSGQDIIKLGMASISCEFMYSAFRNELPDAIGALLQAQTSGIGMYVAQFPEWQKFAENAAAINIDTETTKDIHLIADKIVNDLENNPDLADPEVPRVIKYLNDIIKDPSKAPKKAAFAVLRTLENLVIKVYQYGADFFDQTIRKTSDALSATTSKIVVFALLSLAFSGATGLVPVATKMQVSTWLTQATAIVGQQLKTISPN